MDYLSHLNHFCPAHFKHTKLMAFFQNFLAHQEEKM